MNLSFLLRFFRSKVLKAPIVNSTLMDARSYCARALEDASMGPFTVHITVVLP